MKLFEREFHSTIRDYTFSARYFLTLPSSPFSFFISSFFHSIEQTARPFSEHARPNFGSENNTFSFAPSNLAIINNPPPPFHLINRSDSRLLSSRSGKHLYRSRNARNRAIFPPGRRRTRENGGQSGVEYVNERGTYTRRCYVVVARCPIPLSFRSARDVSGVKRSKRIINAANLKRWCKSESRIASRSVCAFPVSGPAEIHFPVCRSRGGGTESRRGSY